ncbi:MAG TPA: hypothetical protein VFL64_11670 [Rhizobacter sp.]|nr:hypothetical protein [Rhizobacter sp.]
MIPIALATEDALSESLGQRLLAELTPKLPEPMLLRKGGFGYLRSGMPKWRQLSQRQAVVILADLDDTTCPAVLRADWLGGLPCPENLLLRVAVREAESWLLADHEAMRQLMGAKGALPRNPDALPDPKKFVLDLAQKAPRDVRLDMVRASGAMSGQGIGYNARLTALVATTWSPERAAERSPSLGRARIRLRQMVDRLHAHPPA